MTPEATMEQSLNVIEDQFYNSEQTKLYENNDINRELERYFFSIGSHLEDEDQRAFNSKTGGIWIGNSEVEGAPTMSRTNYFANTLGLIPLEKRAIPKKADHRAENKKDENYLTGVGVPPQTRGYMVYPGDNANFLKSDRFRPMGLVEIEQLVGTKWDTKLPLKMQLFFFPQYFQWLVGDKAFPVLVDTKVDMIQDAIERARSSDLQPFVEVGKTMMTSSVIFKSFAAGHIEKNRQIIMSLRSTNNGGFYVGWNGKSISYAKQLGIRLEDERDIQGLKSVDKETQDKILQEIQKDRNIQEQRFAESSKQTNALLIMMASQMGVDLSKFGISTEPEITGAVDTLMAETEYTEQPDISLGAIDLSREEKIADNKEVLDPSPDGRCHFIDSVSGTRCKTTFKDEAAKTKVYCSKCEKKLGD